MKANRGKRLFSIVLIVAITSIANMVYSSCDTEYDGYVSSCPPSWRSLEWYGTPYPPSQFVVDWEDYNSTVDVLDYFMGHDSAIISHAGDTILIWGYPWPVAPSDIHDDNMILGSSPKGDTCNVPLMIRMGKGDFDHWIHEQGRVLYVQGKVAFNRSDSFVSADGHLSFYVEAISIDSVKNM